MSQSNNGWNPTLQRRGHARHYIVVDVDKGMLLHNKQTCHACWQVLYWNMCFWRCMWKGVPKYLLANTDSPFQMLAIAILTASHSHSKPFSWLLLSLRAWGQPAVLFLFSGCWQQWSRLWLCRAAISFHLDCADLPPWSMAACTYYVYMPSNRLMALTKLCTQHWVAQAGECWGTLSAWEIVSWCCLG